MAKVSMKSIRYLVWGKTRTIKTISCRMLMFLEWNGVQTVYAVSGIQIEQVSSMSLNASTFRVDKG